MQRFTGTRLLDLGRRVCDYAKLLHLLWSVRPTYELGLVIGLKCIENQYRIQFFHILHSHYRLVMMMMI